MYLFFCFCSIHIFTYAINKRFYRRTNVRPHKISQIRWGPQPRGGAFGGSGPPSFLVPRKFVSKIW